MSGAVIAGWAVIAFAISLIVCVVFGAMASLDTPRPGLELIDQGPRVARWASCIGLVIMLVAVATGALQ